ncbi:GUN4 domain-containing protein [Geitlerinema sp. PCC 9228]|jgi:serine/threonine-protein kinase|uniref:GUN4 domain-containing protein n=1 Tax=Geitlerinema sp. PCC 9228 TaxID=111611 RepID=UPI0008F984F5|nr:GUN4 domain-containing protein [Geitlerinema sp. PCC 9228]
MRQGASVDCSYLHQLLVAENWQQADRETAALMLRAAGKPDQNWLDNADVENFSRSFLQTIDRLWVKHSQGKFGFSVQYQIWQELGGCIDWETTCHLGDRLGWRQGDRWLSLQQIHFYQDESTPRGHLPWITWCHLWFWGGAMGILFSPLLTRWHTNQDEFSIF